MRKLTSLETDWFRIEKLEVLRATLFMISNWMVLPLYFSFWICDLIYAPDLKWEFLGIRATVIPACLIVQYFAKRINNFRSGEWLALFFIFVLASVINCLIFMLDDHNTPYYAGLNLVAIGSLTFIPWDKYFYIPGFLVIYAPYYIGQSLRLQNWDDFKGMLIHSFFMVATVIIALLIRLFNENLRKKEYLSRVKLNDEIGTRDSLIIEKTEEGIRLNALSRQFSPQVVEAIKTKKLEISTQIRRSEICAIFIDIVNSTEAVIQVDKEKVHETISAFMDDAIKILLKYDVTIDKFLGDGVLAFCNEPVKYEDSVDRVLMAALEIQSRVASRAEFYQKNWISEFQIRVGIAVGQANIGFYGNEKYYRTYTAIGPVVNLASRLCTAALPGQILISKETAQRLSPLDYQLRPLDELRLKGFAQVKAFQLLSKTDNESFNESDTDCPVCNQGIMKIDIDDKGIYILKCNNCNYVNSANADQTQATRLPKAS